MKKVFIFVTVLLCTSKMFAQNSTTASKATPSSELSIGVDGGFPIGDFGDGYKFGIGGTLKYAYNIDNKIALTLTSGYISFSGKSESFDGETFTNPSLGLIPVKVGGRYSFSGGLYVEPQLGVGLFTGGGGGNSTGFDYAINLGYHMVPGFDVAARYEGISKDGTASFIGVRIAYAFALGAK